MRGEQVSGAGQEGGAGVRNEWHCRGFVLAAARRANANTPPCLQKMPRGAKERQLLLAGNLP